MNLNFAKYLDRYLGILLCYLLAALHLFREMVSPREGAIRVRRVLLTKFWGFGNIVLLLPILRLVRRRFPDATIHMLTLERNRELLRGNPHVDRVWCVSDRSFGAFAASMVRALFGLRRSRIDLFLDFEQFSRTSTILGFLVGAPQRVGLHTPRQGRYLLYTAPVRYREDQHMARTFLDIARSGGVREERYVPEPVAYSARDSRRVEELLDGAGRVVAMHPGSGDNFVGRRWPAACFAALGDRLAGAHPVTLALTGSRSERGLVREVIRSMRRQDRVLDLSGRLALRELAALLARTEVLVSNDTGPVHLASSLSVPVLGLYGPNTPELYGPLSPGSRAFYQGLPCSPCITNMNYKTSFCRLPVCIRNITVEEVWGEADRLLRGEAV
jgi:ADP-heptose:LPS heptosyltransferase